MKALKPFIITTLALLAAAGLRSLAWGDDSGNKRILPTVPAMGAVQSERSRSINFEDEVIEGLNKNPLDSLEDIGKRDGRRQPHLYRKKLQFRPEMKETVQEAGYSP